MRPDIFTFLPEETAWLVDFYRSAVAATEPGLRPRLDWRIIADGFNAHFEGRILNGSDRARPARTVGSLQAHCERNPEIAQLKAGRRLRHEDRNE